MLGHLVVRMSRKHNWYAYALWALSIGVATMANKKGLFMTLVDCIPRFDAHRSQCFDRFVITSCLDAYIILFCAKDDNDNKNDTSDYFTPLLMRAARVINASHCSPHYYSNSWSRLHGASYSINALSMGPTDFSYTVAKISGVSISCRGRGAEAPSGPSDHPPHTSSPNTVKFIV